MWLTLALMVHTTRLAECSSAGAPVALILPGAGYTVQAPLLYWSILALAQAGWDVWSIDWHAEVRASAPADFPRFVSSAVAQAEDTMPNAPDLVIGKSLGTYAMPRFVRTDTRAVWLTPILTAPSVAEAAHFASERHLIVGGTADPSWDASALHNTRARVVSVPSGNHSLEIQNAGWHDSAIEHLDLLDTVITHARANR